MKPPKSQNSSPAPTFEELARQLECDDDEARFDANLKKLAKAPPKPKHAPKDTNKP